MTAPSDRTIVTLGCVLFVAYLLMAVLVEWTWLVQLQLVD